MCWSGYYFPACSCLSFRGDLHVGLKVCSDARPGPRIMVFGPSSTALSPHPSPDPPHFPPQIPTSRPGVYPENHHHASNPHRLHIICTNPSVAWTRHVMPQSLLESVGTACRQGWQQTTKLPPRAWYQSGSNLWTVRISPDTTVKPWHPGTNSPHLWLSRNTGNKSQRPHSWWSRDHLPFTSAWKGGSVRISPFSSRFSPPS